MLCKSVIAASLLPIGDSAEHALQTLRRPVLAFYDWTGQKA
jgi:hypothetical protein